MSIFALIAGGTVVQCRASKFDVHPSLVWVDVTAVNPQPQPGWSAHRVGETWAFAVPVVPQIPREAVIRAQLAVLDGTIPRGLEDLWAVSKFDTTTLPAPTQAKLAQKIALRSELAALIAPGTESGL